MSIILTRKGTSELDGAIISKLTELLGEPKHTTAEVPAPYFTAVEGMIFINEDNVTVKKGRTYYKEYDKQEFLNGISA